jgi:endonuclease III-like uncharacterized protein
MNYNAKKRQQNQANEMSKRYVDHVTEVTLGRYVSIRVDKRDRHVNSNRGILGVVSFVSQLKGIHAMTAKGILSFKGKVAIMPPDTYRVLSQFAMVSPELQTISEQVQSGVSYSQFPMVSKQDVHLGEHGSWFHKKCGCKKNAVHPAGV